MAVKVHNNVHLLLKRRLGTSHNMYGHLPAWLFVRPEVRYSYQQAWARHPQMHNSWRHTCGVCNVTVTTNVSLISLALVQNNFKMS